MECCKISVYKLLRVIYRGDNTDCFHVLLITICTLIACMLIEYWKINPFSSPLLSKLSHVSNMWAEHAGLYPTRRTQRKTLARSFYKQTARGSTQHKQVLSERRGCKKA